MSTHSFFDPFFFAILVLVAALTFTDFLLGKEGRGRVKELVGNWWLYLEDATFAGLGASDAAGILRWFRERLGRIVTLRYWSTALGGACVLLFVAFFGLSSLLDGAFFAGAPERLMAVFEILADHSPALFFANALMLVISLTVTLGFLRLMASTQSLVLLLLLTVVDILAVLALIVLTMVIVQNLRTWDVFDFGNVIDQLIWISGGLVALVPITLHIFLLTLFMVSKVTAPIIKRPVNLILLRLHESEKGVLSLVGVAIGALAKLVQEGMKLV